MTDDLRMYLILTIFLITAIYCFWLGYYIKSRELKKELGAEK